MHFNLCQIARLHASWLPRVTIYKVLLQPHNLKILRDSLWHLNDKSSGGRVVCMAQRGALLRHSRPLLSPGHVESAAAQTSRAQLTVLNASAFAGYARDIIQLFADAPEHISHHELLGDLYQRHPDGRVTIDANCSLFHRYRSA
ncbi:hypothetical protein BESB_030850 [Besnoitia besnoiti]|uniref:Uncharacterized protein n=1 Tax=Besnoitia besnoiti TaxID=94643 RepID=A0A2A9M4H8_BESBE|nr:hypothetical protein BESB_030850 [Besnoitia besnoiti]PFH31211.1 hypothetical protein BESB_030850 [Besnoitia besnoiti]